MDHTHAHEYIEHDPGDFRFIAPGHTLESRLGHLLPRPVALIGGTALKTPGLEAGMNGAVEVLRHVGTFHLSVLVESEVLRCRERRCDTTQRAATFAIGRKNCLTHRGMLPSWGQEFKLFNCGFQV